MPGKFERCGEIGQKLYELTLDGGYDEEFGENGTGGTWYALMFDTGIPEAPCAILSEDSDGFVEYLSFKRWQDAAAAWDEMVAYDDEDYDDVDDEFFP